MVEALKAPEGVTILSAPDQTVVKIAELVVAEPEPTEEEVAAAAEGEAAEGEDPKEGDAAAGADKKEEHAKESSRPQNFIKLSSLFKIRIKI